MATLRNFAIGRLHLAGYPNITAALRRWALIGGSLVP